MEEEKTGVGEETTATVDEDLNLDEFLDLDDDDDKSTNDSGAKSEDNDKKPTQTKEERAHFAQLKREEKEKKAREAEEARQAELARIKEQTALETKLGVIKENPWNKKPIKDEYDLKTYEIMKSIFESGGDPINDLPDYLSNQARVVGNNDKAEKAKKVEEETKSKEFDAQLRVSVNEGFKTLHDKYGVDLREITKDKDFLTEISALGVLKGQATVETAYLVMLSKKSIAKKASKEVDDAAKKATTSPSSTSSATPNSKDISKMTPEEFEEYWNRKYGG